MAGDLDAHAASLGIDSADVEADMSSFDDWDNQEVYVGGREITALDERGAEAPDTTRKAGEYRRDFHRKKPGEISALQRRLFAGGFYDVSIGIEDIRWDDYDDETRDAWKQAVSRAAAAYDAGEKKTIDEVIDEAALRRSDAEKGGGRKPRDKRGSLTHPDDIRTAAMKVSSRVLGRGWNADELDRFVNTYQSMERTALESEQNAPSMEAAAERAARTGNSVAAGGKDLADAYEMIVQSMNRLGGKS